MRPAIFAHRGASVRYPENTLAAFRAAHRFGADGIELDVQLTADGEVVVIHDLSLQRTTNGSGLVQNHTLAEIRRLDAGSWLNPRFQESRVPTLEEVLIFAYSTQLRLILELKNFWLPQPGLEEKVIELVTNYQLADRVVISSFNFNSLLEIKRLAPRLHTAMLYMGRLRDPWLIAQEYQADQLHAPYDETTVQLVKQTQLAGLKIFCWTVNTLEQMKRCRSLKVDGIISNYPLRAIKLYQKRAGQK